MAQATYITTLAYNFLDLPWEGGWRHVCHGGGVCHDPAPPYCGQQLLRHVQQPDVEERGGAQEEVEAEVCGFGRG